MVETKEKRRSKGTVRRAQDSLLPGGSSVISVLLWSIAATSIVAGFGLSFSGSEYWTVLVVLGLGVTVLAACIGRSKRGGRRNLEHPDINPWSV